MLKLHEMRQQLSKLALEMRALNKAAKDEKRAFSESETSKWGDLVKQHDDLSAEIQREEQLQQLDNELADKEHDEQRSEDADAGQTDESRAYAAAFENFVRRGFGELTADEKKKIKELRALSSGVGSEGGFTVPTDFRAKVIEVMKQYGGLASVCTILDTGTGQPLDWVITDGTTEEGEMLGESDAASESDPSFASVSLGAKKASSKLIKVPNELLQDSAINLEELLARKIGVRLGRTEAKQIMVGDGTGNNVKGLLNQITLTKEAAAVAAIAYDDLIELKHAVDPAYRMGEGCGFMFNDNTFKSLKLLKDSNGRPLWLPAIAGVAPATIDGDRYTIDQALPDAAASAKSVVYGDFKSVILRRIKYLALRRLTERFAENDQTGFIGFARFDMVLEDKAAVAALAHPAV